MLMMVGVMLNKNVQKPWIIVDGYSSGKLFVLLLKELGISAYHIQSSNNVPEFYYETFDEKQYLENFIYEGDFTNLVARLRELEFSVIIAGSEPGVELADKLSSELDTPSNGVKCSKARRDKYEMVQALVKNGVRAAKTYKVTSKQELDYAAKKIGFPIVVKPSSSAGSDGVFICNTLSESNEAFNEIYLQKDRLGSKNDFVIAQELLKGKQYIVNTVSYDAKHYAAEIWVDNRIDTGSEYIYDHEKIIHEITEQEAKIIDYTFKVLDALEIKYGPCHVELMVDNGVPTLIEVGSRPAGGINHETMFDAQGFSHVSAAIDCYLNPQKPKFTTLDKEKKQVLAVALISSQSGYLKAINGIEKIQSLPSFSFITGLPNIGDYVPVTRDIFSQPGLLMLTNSSEKQISSDLDRFRNLENELFVLD